MQTLSALHELALFAGAGGGILGGKLLGWRTVCAVEWNAYARDVLVARQNDGCLEVFPIWDDVQTFDGRPWRGRIDVVSGGFPCQDISVAGKGDGLEGQRSGMWVEMARIVNEVGPSFVLVENSPMLTSRGLGRVLGDLAEMGYHARWGVVGASAAGAPHKRERIWIVAHTDRAGLQDGWTESNGSMVRCDGGGEAARDHLSTPAESSRGEVMAHTANGTKPRRSEVTDERGAMVATRPRANGRNISRDTPAGGQDSQRNQVACGPLDVADSNLSGCQEQRSAIADGAQYEAAECGSWWATEPDVGRMAHGVAARVDRLQCLGNGQVSGVVPIAWRQLLSQMNAGSDARRDASPNQQGGLSPSICRNLLAS